ncbi:MAG: hypothetical protein Q7J73_09100 [Dehalococcoidales bacterium]|nr:hypothetical protein [Dehalococcoidales bacterium]
MENEEQRAVVSTGTSPPLTVIVQVPAEIVMYNVSEAQLDALVNGASSNSIHLAFLGICIGAFLAFGIVLLTVPLESKMFATFVGLLAVSIVLSFYFGIRTIVEIKANTKRFNQIRQRRYT